VFDEEVGPGLPLWLPNGGIMIEELEGLAKEMETGSRLPACPHAAPVQGRPLPAQRAPALLCGEHVPADGAGRRALLRQADELPLPSQDLCRKPRSYRDLPLRLAEYGTCYRYEKSGELFGLMRVRSMQMNDAHIYCERRAVRAGVHGGDRSVPGVLQAVRHRQVRHAPQHASQEGLGKKYVDNERLWLKTEDMVRRAMQNGGVPYVEQADEAAFYGPKIDVQIWSAIGREFTLATNQVDFAQPARFDLKFVNATARRRRRCASIAHR
jgi:threonyl-tRNA synthetase